MHYYTFLFHSFCLYFKVSANLFFFILKSFLAFLESEVHFTSFQLETIPKQSVQQPEDMYNSNTYTCRFCGLNCDNPSRLKKHLLSHSGDRPFVCSVCGASFRQKSHVTQHFAIHTGKKPYICSFCGKAFARRYVCQKHALSHYKKKQSLNES